LAPDLLSGKTSRKEFSLLCVVAVLHDRGSNHAQSHNVDEIGDTGTLEFLVGDPLKAGLSMSAVLHWIICSNQTGQITLLLPTLEIVTLLDRHHLDRRDR
jgi:hypothetical protein